MFIKGFYLPNQLFNSPQANEPSTEQLSVGSPFGRMLRSYQQLQPTSAGEFGSSAGSQYPAASSTYYENGPYAGNVDGSSLPLNNLLGFGQQRQMGLESIDQYNRGGAAGSSRYPLQQQQPGRFPNSFGRF